MYKQPPQSMGIARGCLYKKVAYGHKTAKVARGCLYKKVAYGHKIAKVARGCLYKGLLIHGGGVGTMEIGINSDSYER